jgi:L-threonylcarbamoyladenylate synthase
MRILSKENLAEVVELLRAGETVVFPTETTYGLGCDATNQTAVEKIFKIKGRKADKPFLAVVPTIEVSKEYLEWNELLQKISEKYWPGAVTVVGRAKENFFINGIVAQDKTMAVRVTADPWLNELATQFGKPVVATSANLADQASVYSVDEIKEIFENQEFKPDAIVDAGVLPQNPPTTIVSVVNNELKILRQGGVAVDLN